MAEAFAAYELIRGLCPNVEADVIAEINSVESLVRSQVGPMVEDQSLGYLQKLAIAIERVIEHRELLLIEAMRKALQTRPPAEIDEETKASLSNFLMADLGQYYNHGSVRLRPTKSGSYLDGLPPDLRRHETKTRTHLFTMVEIALVEIGKDAKHPDKKPAAGSTMDIFISHSNEDRDFASALINLLRNAFNILAERIRCTSVDGYRLEVGANTDEQIRTEVRGSRVFVGLITPASVKSSYVLFELGARWGAELSLSPLLAKGATAGLLPGPISGKNALCADSDSQMHQFLQNVAAQLGQPAPNPSVYGKQLNEVVRLSIEAGLFVKYEGLRIRGAGAEQFFITGQESHYLDVGAAQVCDHAGLPVNSVDSATEAGLLKSRGADFNTELMQAALREKRGATHSVVAVRGASGGGGRGALANLVSTLAAQELKNISPEKMPAEQVKILLVLWDNRSCSTETVAEKASIDRSLAKYHIGELEKRQFVYIPVEIDGDGDVSISQEGRHYIVSNGLVPRQS